MSQIGRMFTQAVSYLLNHGKRVFCYEHKKQSKKTLRKRSKVYAMLEFSKNDMKDAAIDLFLERPVISKEEESCDTEK